MGKVVVKFNDLVGGRHRGVISPPLPGRSPHQLGDGQCLA